ncbi:MAG: nucleotide-binding protein [Candidatus Saccharibacteria bacterium]|nr:nucleotide-binding protein [Candidatus Saccharibacteria bacterium]
MLEKVVTLPREYDSMDLEKGLTRVIEIMVRPGDYINENDSIIVVENDLFTMEIPAPQNGIVNELLVSLGQEVHERTALMKYSPVISEKESVANQESSVFLVHGRNDGLKETVARCVEKLGLTVTILHEKPNEGKTIIEKLEKNSSVSFAIVLMTADDKGALRESELQEYKLRARQNVIFELGYFIAKLGRKNVCALYESSVEIPSDYYGVTYLEIDDKGVWRYQLARELNQAGLTVDLNNLIK